MDIVLALGISVYVVLWVLILIGPWVFIGLGSVSGPLLALKIPFRMLISNYYHPVEMWSTMNTVLKSFLGYSNLLISL